MKGMFKYIVLFLTALALSALAVLPAWADSNNSCDICIETTYEPDDHCSYYCTGDGSDTCDCGGEMIVWCVAVHQFELKRLTAGPDCMTNGTATYACKCGAEMTTNEGPVSDHTWDQGEADPTVGKIYYTCTVCGETKAENYTPGETTTPTDPAPDETTTTPTDPTDPTDPEDPEDTGDGTTSDTTCSHTYVASVVPATCTDQGYTVYTCSKCGAYYVDDYVAALGHLAEKTVISPTCTAEGYTNNVCQREGCGDDWISDRVPALGHNLVNHVCTRCGYTDTCTHTYVEKVYPATCNDFGYTLYICTKCEYAYMDNYTQQLSHVWKVENIVEPTCEKNGYKESVCTLCGEFDTVTLNANGHKWEAKSSVVGEDNTTNVTYKCSVCGKTKVETLPTAAAQAQNWLLTSIRGASEGLINMYETLANGIEVGGVTAGEVITSSLIVACLLLLVLLFFKVVK